MSRPSSRQPAACSSTRPPPPQLFLARRSTGHLGANEAAVWHSGPPPRRSRRTSPATPAGRRTRRRAEGQFTPDDAEVVTVGIGDHRVLAFNAISGNPHGDLLDGRDVTEGIVAFSPDHKVIASGDVSSGHVHLLGPGQRPRALSLRHRRGRLDHGVAWDPQRPILATSTGAPGSTRLLGRQRPAPPRKQRLQSVDTTGRGVSLVQSRRPLGRHHGRLRHADGATVFDVATGRKLLSFGGDRTLTQGCRSRLTAAPWLPSSARGKSTAAKPSSTTRRPGTVEQR